jgi:3-dehydroquinate dehydratase-2
MHLMVLHGPNLNLLGVRETSLYGADTLEELNNTLLRYCSTISVTIEIYQSNTEGQIVDLIQSVLDPLKENTVDGIIINPAAYTHTSVAIRDALLAVDIPFVEVHLSNIFARESFRHHSMLSDIAIGNICGFGVTSYLLGIQGLISYIQQN